MLLVLHCFEDRKSSNSGRLLTHCLANSQVLVRGRPGEPLLLPEFTQSTRPLVLFPAADALPLEDFVDSPLPATLIVPDGTWRQAAKAKNRIDRSRRLTCVKLPQGAPLEQRLRVERREAGLPTMAAVARALGILEGEAVERALDAVFRTFVERSLEVRAGAAPVQRGAAFI